MRKLMEAVEQAQTANPVDTVTVDIPLLIRLLEFSREDAKTDMDLHNLADNMINLSPEGNTLTMADYEELIMGLAGDDDAEGPETFTTDDGREEPVRGRMSDDDDYGVGGLIDQGR